MSEKNNFNYRIAQFFLNNNRLTLLAFIVIIILGIATTILLKTTGFPQPEIKVIVIQTIYPGASAETMAADVSQPIEGAIKNIAGIANYQSTSSNSVSAIRVDVREEADTNAVRSQIEAAINSLALPADANTPLVLLPSFSGPDLIVSLTGADTETLYTLYQRFSADVNQLSDTSSVEPIVPIERQLLITLQPDQLQRYNLSTTIIEQQLQTIGENIPVVSNQAIDDTSYSVVTTSPDLSLDSIKQLPLATSATGGQVRLADVADVTIAYQFTNQAVPYIGLRAGDDTYVGPALVLNIKAATEANLGEYTETVKQLMTTYDDVTVVLPGEETTSTAKPLMVLHYTSNYFNERQVHEVVSGLIGGPLDINGSAAQLGWALGGIQLVFLVMLAFVSWRAALVSALAIPLSLVFSTIYLYVIGEDLNTLVLFSLVLVIGLVVDPALVILESIQRKIDLGLKGKAAALAAVEDVGMGLFLATLTNIIVFVPFAVISGFLGEIFAYIPLTIIPATIGSYIVPLIFLAWIGGLFLKPSRQHGDDEIKNLWKFSQWLIRFNHRILNSSVWLRLGLIVGILAVSFGITSWYFSSGHIKTVQFSSGVNGNYLELSSEFLPTATATQQNELLKQTLETIISNPQVQQVYPLAGNTPSYFINLQPARERGNYLSTQITADILTDLKTNGLFDQYYDLNMKVDAPATASSAFPIALAIKSNNPTTLKTAAGAIADTLTHVCLVDAVFTIDPACTTGKKIVIKTNDGYTSKTNQIIEVTLDRAKLQQYQLAVPNAPLTLLVNQLLRQHLNVSPESTTSVLVDNAAAAVTMQFDVEVPTTLEALRELELIQTPQGPITLDDVADVSVSSEAASIRRVKGETVGVVQAKLADGYNDQMTATSVTNAVLDYYQADDGARLKDLQLESNQLELFSEGDTASTAKSFSELFIALILAIILSYVVLVVFFESFTQPLVILFTIPLSFIGIFPALAHIGNGQFGFLEIIGLIILVGIVENVAIFLIDAARQKTATGLDDKTAISQASGLRLRPVLLTKFTALASLTPLAILSETYRPISLVIIFGLLTSGFTSLITTPILFIFFRWLSRHFHALNWWNKILFFVVPVVYVGIFVWQDKK